MVMLRIDVDRLDWSEDSIDAPGRVIGLLGERHIKQGSCSVHRESDEVTWKQTSKQVEGDVRSEFVEEDQSRNISHYVKPNVGKIRNKKEPRPHHTLATAFFVVIMSSKPFALSHDPRHT